MNEQFNTLDLREELLSNLSELGFSKMTPIQMGSLPKVLDGKDVLGQAKTGSGKTAAFGLGILNELDTTIVHTQSLILCPTRELAEQVAVEIRKLARMMKNVKVLTITGGVGYYHQENSLSHGAHIIVGTPGRVKKLIKTNFIRLSNLKFFVLDEADRMLDMGFYDDIMDIEEKLPRERQSLLFSATFPEEILDLSEDIQYDAYRSIVDSKHEEGHIEQYFYSVSSHKDKEEALLKLLGEYQPKRLIIFCKTKVTTDKVARFLNKNDIAAASIHGNLDQNERTRVLTKFSNRSLSALVATDVAARGLDIKELEAVINFDLAIDPQDYIHRVGRTGRAGEKGLAFSLFVEQERYKIEEVEELQNLKHDTLDSNDLSLKSYDLSPPMRTLFISGGKKDKLRPGDILGALVKEALLSPDEVGNITILPILSYVAVKSDKLEQAISKLNEGRIKNRKFRVGVAN